MIRFHTSTQFDRIGRGRKHGWDYANGVLLGTTTSDASGAWSFTTPAEAPLADGLYSMTAVSTDAAGNQSSESLALSVLIDVTGPVFNTSTSTSVQIDENSGTGQLIYTAVATDSSAILFSIKENNSDDAAAFTIDPSSGEVRLTVNPDFEAKSSYSFVVIATDSAGNATEQSVSLTINDVDDTAPVPPSLLGLFSDQNVASSVADNLTKSQNPTISGRAEAGSSVEIFADMSCWAPCLQSQW